jgi:AcrR family transcriptional regulator
MPQRSRRNADQVLINALACGATIETAAHKAGVSPATVYRRLQDQTFQRLLQQSLSDMVKRTAGSLTALGQEAVRALAELLKPPTPATVRLGAARAVLESGLKVREVADFEPRLAALEQHMLDQQETA